MLKCFNLHPFAQSKCEVSPTEPALPPVLWTSTWAGCIKQAFFLFLNRSKSWQLQKDQVCVPTALQQLCIPAPCCCPYKCRRIVVVSGTWHSNTSTRSGGMHWCSWAKENQDSGLAALFTHCPINIRPACCLILSYVDCAFGPFSFDSWTQSVF